MEENAGELEGKSGGLKLPLNLSFKDNKNAESLESSQELNSKKAEQEKIENDENNENNKPPSEPLKSSHRLNLNRNQSNAEDSSPLLLESPRLSSRVGSSRVDQVIKSSRTRSVSLNLSKKGGKESKERIDKPVDPNLLTPRSPVKKANNKKTSPKNEVGTQNYEAGMKYLKNIRKSTLFNQEFYSTLSLALTKFQVAKRADHPLASARMGEVYANLGLYEASSLLKGSKALESSIEEVDEILSLTQLYKAMHWLKLADEYGDDLGTRWYATIVFYIEEIIRDQGLYETRMKAFVEKRATCEQIHQNAQRVLETARENLENAKKACAEAKKTPEEKEDDSGARQSLEFAIKLEEKGKHKTAREIYTRLGEQGVGKAYLYLAHSWENSNPEEAENAYRNALKKGAPFAQLELDVFLAEKAMKKAKEDLKKANTDFKEARQKIDAIQGVKKEREKISAESEETSQSLKKANDDLQEAEKKCKKTQADLVTAEENLKTAEEKYKKTQADLATQKEDLQAAEEKHKKAQEDLKKPEEDLKKAREDLEKVQTAFDKASILFKTVSENYKNVTINPAAREQERIKAQEDFVEVDKVFDKARDDLETAEENFKEANRYLIRYQCFVLDAESNLESVKNFEITKKTLETERNNRSTARYDRGEAERERDTANKDLEKAKKKLEEAQGEFDRANRKGMENYIVAADRNHTGAQYALAMLLMDTHKSEAIKWLRKAAKRGHKKARAVLGAWLLDHTPFMHEALFWLKACGDKINLTESQEKGFQYVEDEYTKALRKKKEGKQEDEQEILTALTLGYNSGHIGAAYELAVYYESRKMTEEAFNVFRRLAEEQDDEESQCCYARLMEERNPDAAEKWYREALKNGYLLAYFDLGVFLSGSKKINEAQKCFESLVLRIQSYAIEVQESLETLKSESAEQPANGVQRLQEDNWYEFLGIVDPTAEGWFKERLEILGLDESTKYRPLFDFFNEGIAFAQQGKNLRAESLLRVTRSMLRSLAGQAYYNLALLSEHQEKIVAARRHFEAAANLGHPRAQYQFSLYLANEGQKEQALSWCRKAAAQEDLDAALDIALVTKEEGDLVGAEENYRKILASAPNCIEALVNLGIILHEKNLKEAEALYVRAAHLEDSKAQSLLGDICLKRSDVEGAKRYYRRAFENGRASAGFRLARLFEKEGNYGEAMRLDLEAARKGSEEAQFNTGKNFENLEEFKKAIWWYGEAAKLTWNHEEEKYERDEAAAEGYAPARRRLGLLLINTEDESLNIKRGRSSEDKSEEGLQVYTDSSSSSQRTRDGKLLTEFVPEHSNVSMEISLAAKRANGYELLKAIESEEDPEVLFALGKYIYSPMALRGEIDEAIAFYKRAAKKKQPRAVEELYRIAAAFESANREDKDNYIAIRYSGEQKSMAMVLYAFIAEWAEDELFEIKRDAQYRYGVYLYEGTRKQEGLKFLNFAKAGGHEKATGFLEALERKKEEKEKAS